MLPTDGAINVKKQIKMQTTENLEKIPQVKI